MTDTEQENAVNETKHESVGDVLAERKSKQRKFGGPSHDWYRDAMDRIERAHARESAAQPDASPTPWPDMIQLAETIRAEFANIRAIMAAYAPAPSDAPASGGEVEALAQLIASELAAIDGYDPDDERGGLYDLRWSGGAIPEPQGDAWSMDYLPKGERIARRLAARQPTVIDKLLATAPVGYHYRTTDPFGQEVWTFDLPHGRPVLETRPVYYDIPLPVRQPAPEEMVTLLPGFPAIPRRILNAAAEVENYMRLHHPAPWSLFGIQSVRGESHPAPTAAVPEQWREAAQKACNRIKRLALECPQGSRIRDDANEWAGEFDALLTAPPQPAGAEVPEETFSWALEQGGILADWCNVAGDALTALMAAYERRVRTLCATESDLAAQPWRCAEYVQAEEAMSVKPVPVAMLAAAPKTGAESRAVEAMSRMKDAAIEAHRLCYESMLAHPEVATLGDDGALHKAIHAIVGVDTPAYVEAKAETHDPDIDACQKALEIIVARSGNTMRAAYEDRFGVKLPKVDSPGDFGGGA